MRPFDFSRVISFASLTLLVSSASQAAIFGADDRQVITSETPLMGQLARLTAIAILSANQTTNPKTGLIDLDAPPSALLCPEEPFVKDPQLAYSCTGFLVGPNLLATAGHCVYAVNNPNQELVNETGLACKAFDWLFDFEQAPNGTTQTTAISPSRMYHCAKIIYAVQKESPPYDDYALIQLDRPVFGRTPLQLSATPVSTGEPLTLIGYPLGTPVKSARNAKVTINTASRSTFLSTLDAVEGDSGGPVFNEQNQIVGILVGGTPMYDTYRDEKANCSRVNHCNADGSVCTVPDSAATIAQLAGYQGVGSEVMRIAPIVDLLKKLAAPQNP